MNAPRGGERIGAGRPRLAREMKRESVSLRLHPKTIARLHALADSNGVTVTEMIEALINN